MRSLEKGQDKIQKICDKLRHETLEPAEREAQQIIEEARKKAEAIQAEAERHAEQLIKQARGQIEFVMDHRTTSAFRRDCVARGGPTASQLRQEAESGLFRLR